MRSHLGLPKHQHFQWKSLPPQGLGCIHHLQGELPLQNCCGGAIPRAKGEFPKLGKMLGDIIRICLLSSVISVSWTVKNLRAGGRWDGHWQRPKMTLAWAEGRGRRAGALFWSQLCSGLICCVTLGRSLPVSESQFPQIPKEVGGLFTLL